METSTPGAGSPNPAVPVANPSAPFDDLAIVRPYFFQRLLLISCGALILPTVAFVAQLSFWYKMTIMGLYFIVDKWWERRVSWRHMYSAHHRLSLLERWRNRITPSARTASWRLGLHISFLLLAVIGFAMEKASGAVYPLLQLSQISGSLIVLVVFVLFAWNTFRISRGSNDYAVLRLTALLFAVIVLFSRIDWEAGLTVGCFTPEPLTKIDALYFAVTTLLTVGYGDIHPSSQGCRALVTGQLLLGFVLVGVMLTAAISAVVARPRKSTV